MSITKRQGVGGKSSIRQLSRLGERVMNRANLEGRNARRVMKKLREQYGDELIDQEMERLKNENGK